MPFIGLFKDLKAQTKFEASGITTANGSFYVVFDSIQSVAKLDDRFDFNRPTNVLIGTRTAPTAAACIPFALRVYAKRHFPCMPLPYSRTANVVDIARYHLYILEAPLGIWHCCWMPNQRSCIWPQATLEKKASLRA